MAIEAVEEILPPYEGTDAVPEAELTNEELAEGVYEVAADKKTERAA